MTTQAATFGLAPVPISVRKKSFEILAELQPTVGVRHGERALDVVGDRLAGGVRQIVERQDQHVVAHADAAVLAPPALELQIRLRAMSPPLGLEIMDVDVLALGDIGDRSADVLAVFDDGVALLDVGERDLVADRHVHLGAELERGIVRRHHAQHVGAAFKALDGNHADGVFFLVH